MLSTAFLLAASMVVGQAGQSSSHESFQAMGDKLAGVGVHRFETPDGEKVIRYVRCDWALDKNVIVAVFSTDKEGNDPVYRAMAAWDASAKQIRHMGVSSDGELLIGTWFVEGDTLGVKFTRIDKEGRKADVIVSYKNDIIERDGQVIGSYERLEDQ